MVNPTARPLRIASRGSPLALWQANTVRDALLRHDPELQVEINVIRTIGDRVTDAPLSQIGDRGVFTKEIDSAVLENTADIAVHSLKDLPTRITEGLALVAITQREDPRDVRVLQKMGELYQKKNEPQQAANYFGKVAEIAGKIMEMLK